jgi:hypothetical protein
VGDELDTLGIGLGGGGRRAIVVGAARLDLYGGREGSVACCLRGYMWLPAPSDVDGGLVTRS